MHFLGRPELKLVIRAVVEGKRLGEWKLEVSSEAPGTTLPSILI